MKKPLVAIGLLQLIVALQAHAQPTFGSGNTVVFATVEEARTVLTNRDDYVERLSPFDRAAKLKTDRDVSEAEYLAAV
ncbi:MAG TPA: hypothetical protein VK968_13220, partial [Roseimicrobium sp.]|nr:hypothetical protein [Roseimicrobium sp.]